MQRSIPPAKNNRSTDALFAFTLIIGVAIGAVLMTMVGFGLWIFDYVCVYDVDCPAAQHMPDFAQTATVEAQFQELNPPIPPGTPEPTLAPDLGATATAACGSFETQFPGTPCPAP